MNSAIVPLSPGERPTEPGWYVVDVTIQGKRLRTIVEADAIDGDPDPVENEGAYLWFSGRDHGHRAVNVDATFIARIYPDRIEGRDG